MLLVLSFSIRPAAAQGTAFTYQGKLNNGSAAASGSYDFEFALYDDPQIGSQIGPAFTNSAVNVTNGLFMTTLDFGTGVFTGRDMWLQILVRTNGNGAFAELLPRQALMPAPYAIFANTASNVSGTVSAAQLSGTFPAQLTGTIPPALLPGTVVTNNETSVAVGTLAMSSTLYLPLPALIRAAGDTLMYADNNNNLFFGLQSGNVPTAGNGNTGCGVDALYDIYAGSQNTGSGFRALYSDTSGSNNVAVGVDALRYNTTGYDNTAVGYDTLVNNNGGFNVAVGGEALKSANTYYDVAVGDDALFSETTGGNNTAVGNLALDGNTTGGNNIGIGSSAGISLTTGNNNIDIGSDGNAGEGNTIRIGNQGMQTKTFIAGISGATAASGVAVYVNSSGQLGTLSSSAKFKQNIQSMNDASDVLLSLHPVTFKYKPELDPQGIPQFGLVAEEVEKVDPDLVAHDDQGKIYTVRYEAVNAMLLNEFLKQHRTVEEQSAEIKDLKQSLDKLTKVVQTISEK